VIASRREYQGVVELDCEADIYVCLIDGMTSLIIASTHSHLDAVEALLESVVDIDDRSNGASTAL
jgi:ankyrin repeat protein